MEKNTLLAVVLSVAVLILFYVMQGMFFTPPATVETPPQSVESVPQAVPAPAASTPQAVEISEPVAAPAVSAPTTTAPATTTWTTGSGFNGEPAVDLIPLAEEIYTIETELVTIKLSNVGGDIISWKLKQHDDKDQLVEMVLPGTNEPHAFTISFENIENIFGGRLQPVSSVFHMNRTSDYTIEFYQDFAIPNSVNALGEPNTFTLTKRYEFKPNEYMFALNIILDSRNTANSFNFNGAAYTLAFGPQIGPRFQKLDFYSEYRQYLTYGKKVKQTKPRTINRDMPDWAAIAGKYFLLIAIPHTMQYNVAFSEEPEDGLPSASRMLISRSAYNGSKLEDRYLFYMGPKSTDTMSIYYNGKNGFGLHGVQLSKAAKGNTFFSIPPLEKILKWFLIIFHKIVPNYGIAILLLTLLVKILLFPLTKKGSQMTLRMQALAPKIKEIQTKYKDNPQKLQTEMAELYKKEGYNPLSGCLPMLLQFPIFICMYNLFINHFDLRGAMFIPGWIPDLSLPEAIVEFPVGFHLPILGWTALRLLPFLYVASQLLYAKATQTPDQKANPQMKMLLYVMPIVFFFILYNVPSGLLVYWIFSNLLTMVQQIVINKYFVPKKKVEVAPPEPVLPPKKRKRK